jgi:hypothetical protein
MMWRTVWWACTIHYTTSSFYLTTIICHFPQLLCHMCRLCQYEKQANSKWQLTVVRLNNDPTGYPSRTIGVSPPLEGLRKVRHWNEASGLCQCGVSTTGSFQNIFHSYHWQLCNSMSWTQLRCNFRYCSWFPTLNHADIYTSAWLTEICCGLHHHSQSAVNMPHSCTSVNSVCTILIHYRALQVHALQSGLHI